MNQLRHTPGGRGHPYRVEPDQRHPVQLVAGDRFELRVLTDAGVGAVAVELDDDTVHPLTPASPDDLYGTVADDDGHLAAASGARPDYAPAVVWRTELVASASGTVRYRFTAGPDVAPTEWFVAPVGRWCADGPNGAALAVEGRDDVVEHSDTQWLVTDDGPVAVRLALRLDPGAHVVGFGERFDQLDQRGHRPDTVVFEQYKRQGHRTYLPSPFAVVTGGGDDWGFHVRTSRRVHFDVGATDPERLGITLAVDPDDPRVELRVYDGRPAEVVAAHVAELGGFRRPPDWVFTPWMSANNWNTQSRVLDEVRRGVELGVPAGVVVIEAWSDESTFCVFRDAEHEVRSDGAALTLADIRHPTDGAWPDPVAMVDELHRLGVRVLLWQIPLIPTDRGATGQVAADAVVLAERGWCVADDDGSPYHNRGWWFPGALLPDWTNPEATAWWVAKRRYLLSEVGIDGFKTDGGEHAWGDELRYADGSRGSTSNNRFANRYAAAYTGLLGECGVDGVTFSRAGFTGAGATPCHWAGDESSTWEAFRASIVAGSTAGISGVSFWGWDFAGFSGPLPSVELYVRAAAMAALCPIMQYHSEFDAGDVAVGGTDSGLADPAAAGERPRRRDRTPWNVADQHDDRRALDLYRRFAVLRQRLAGYLTASADRSVATGLPMMRALCLDAPDDPAIWNYPHQYLLGEELLVAPVCHEGATSVEVHLPAGDWVEVWSGAVHHGPVAVARPVPLDEIAAYARVGGAADVARWRQLFADLPGDDG